VVTLLLEVRQGVNSFQSFTPSIEFISSTVLTLQCNILDEKMAIAASKEGAVFKDNTFVKVGHFITLTTDMLQSVDFNEETNIWTISATQNLLHSFGKAKKFRLKLVENLLTDVK
jgi:hypothetical protein